MKWFMRVVLVLVLSAFFYFALRNAPLIDIWKTLRGLHLWQLAVLVGLNSLIYVLITARWWFIVRAENKKIPFFPLIGVRISVFAISYFTAGPQIGGEPLQVLYLRRNHGLTYTRATASVVTDKLLEFLANFIMLVFGLTAIFHSGFLPEKTGLPIPILIGLGFLVLWPLVHLLLLYNRHYPLSALLHNLPQQGKFVRFTRACEHLAGQFCQRHPRALIAAILVSLIASVATVSEYALITSFLNVGLPFWQTATAWTAGWLSFLVPLPGGLGALEASQVYALGFFGISAASALSVTLLMRGRDLVIGGLGLLLAGYAARRV
jgi:glycosyltransferase 2 family protein